jgi:molybdopterin/thiamine biosynthesis adenylyltransferase
LHPRAVSGFLYSMSSTCEKETHSQRYTPAHGLSTGEMKQFGRQLIVSEFGVSAQERLKHACVLVVGCGGLGSPVILYLAASGVGKVCLVDGDVVESSNLHRQVLFCRQDVGKKKAVAAESAMLQRNGDMSSMAFSVMLTEENAGGLMAEAAPDIIVDCTDSMPTKYLLNRLGVEHGVPVVTGSVIGMEGQVTVFLNNNKKKTKEKKEGEEVEEEQEPPTPNRQACYACLYPTPPPATQKCNDTGVLGPVCGIIGSMEAVECIKVLTDMGADSVRERSRRILHGRMLNFDALTATARTMRLPAANPKCCV